ncbi:MAG: hypothetical protein WBB36_00345 [Chitinophagales bacterium]
MKHSSLLCDIVALNSYDRFAKQLRAEQGQMQYAFHYNTLLSDKKDSYNIMSPLQGFRPI